jgi:hypothetical protein
VNPIAAASVDRMDLRAFALCTSRRYSAMDTTTVLLLSLAALILLSLVYLAYITRKPIE